MKIATKHKTDIHMKTKRPVHLMIIPLVLACLGASCAPMAPARRVGMVTQLRPEKMAEYKRLHADANAGVRDLLARRTCQNTSRGTGC